MGSVKDFVVIRQPTLTEMGLGNCVFSNRYSVLDWGKKRRMPDEIPYADASRCMISAYVFDELRIMGFLTHYLGLVNPDDSLVSVKDAAQPLNSTRVRLANAYEPEVDGDKYDYEVFGEVDSNFVVPMEFIYRNSLPRGSSVFKRIEDGSLSLATMNLADMPQEYQRLAVAFLDISTKFEEIDRYPDEKKGESFGQFLCEYVRMSPNEIEKARNLILAANGVITSSLAKAELSNDDGKLELAYAPGRQLIIVDEIATPDSCRFTYPVDGVPVDLSKEIPRQWYRIKDKEWVAEVDAAKKEHPTDWHDHVTREPKHLPADLVEMLSYVYRATANGVIGRDVFPGVPRIPEIAMAYKEYRDTELVA
jgi:phosphoribosylaminoimidazole-succinocarboxamide synthase